MNLQPKIVEIYMVLPPRCTLLDVAGPIEALGRANLEQNDVQFNITYVAARQVLLSSVGLTLSGLEPFGDELPDDAVILVAGGVDRPLGKRDEAARIQDLADEEELVNWLRRVVRPTHRIVTICGGALFAGRAGLCDGKSCTTHHSDCDRLAAIAPTAKVLQNRLFVQDGMLYSSAGVTTGIDLMLYLMQEWVHRNVVVAVARYLVVYMRRSGSEPQLSPWLESRDHIHPAVHRVQDAVAADPARRWSQKQLARIAGASGRHLSRLFHEHAGMRLVEYRNSLRIALAKELIGQSRMSVEEVAERVGFESARQFRRAWKEIYDSAPRDSRMQARGPGRSTVKFDQRGRAGMTALPVS